ncbi:hypothetical protein ACJX0J_034935, partial [Zea mays]
MKVIVKFKYGKTYIHLPRKTISLFMNLRPLQESHDTWTYMGGHLSTHLGLQMALENLMLSTRALGGWGVGGGGGGGRPLEPLFVLFECLFREVEPPLHLLHFVFYRAQLDLYFMFLWLLAH